MALFESIIFSSVSGKLGGVVFSRNKGGSYIRGKGNPTNPNTAAQIASRTALSTLVDSWTNLLTQAQRDAWIVYALNTPVLNRLGQTKTISGQQMYVRSNTPRIRAGIARVDDGPTLFDLGTFTTPSFTVSAGDPAALVITFTDTDEWANAAGGFLIGLASRGQNATKVFFKAPFQLSGSIAGDPVPPASPTTLTSPFTYAQGQKVFLSFRASQDDGRLSTTQIVDTIVTA